MRFIKASCSGNDFVILDAFDGEVRGAMPADLSGLARSMCVRSTGVGADGVLVLEPPSDSAADARLTIYNADGSLGAMCANGLRGAARVLMERSRIDASRPIRIAIHDRVVPITITRKEDGAFAWAESDIGLPNLDLGAIPVDASRLDAPPAPNSPTIRVAGVDVVAVSMGNPHAVVISESPESDMRRLGSVIENHPAFPQRTNVHFMKPRSRDAAMVYSWERGVGHTLACGSGACACAAAGNRLGILNPRVTILAPGGTLVVTIDPASGHTLLTGPATIAFEGEWRGAPVMYSKRAHARPSTPSPPPDLRTERLLLRQITSADAPAQRRIAEHREVAIGVASIPHPYPPGEEHRFLERVQTWRDEKLGVGWGITLKDTGTIIGSVGIRFDSEDCGELGYLIDPAHWRKGIATEAAHAVMEFAFTTLGLARLTAGHYSRNPVSGAVLRKCGFTHIGTQTCPCTGRQTLETSEEYEITRAAWESFPGRTPAML